MSCFSVEHTGNRHAGPTCCAPAFEDAKRVDERAGGRGLSAWEVVKDDETMAKPD